MSVEVVDCSGSFRMAYALVVPSGLAARVFWRFIYPAQITGREKMSFDCLSVGWF